MFETETLGPCLVWKLKWGWPWPLAPPPLPNGYAPVLNEIIGVIGHENTIYCKANKSWDEIIDGNTEYSKRWRFKITEKEKNLPIMYLIPKMHKNPPPPGAPFIIVSKICSTKQIFKSISNVFKLIYFVKILSSHQIITSFGSYKILTHHSIIK